MGVKTVKLTYTELSLELHAKAKTKLNYWAGSSLRGALNQEMKRVYCTDKSGDCTTCQNEMCPNKLLFCESTVTDKKLNTNTAVITCEKQTAPTDILNAKIVLLGTGQLATKSLIDTLENGVQLGISRELFSLEGYKQERLQLDTSNIEKCSKLRLTFKSPLIRKSSRDINFASIINAVTVRVGALVNTMGIENDMDHMGLRDRARLVYTRESVIRPEYVHRSSSRIHKNYEMMGLVGYCEYTGNISEYIPYLKVAETFGIGKYCSMGLGQLAVEIMGV